MLKNSQQIQKINLNEHTPLAEESKVSRVLRQLMLECGNITEAELTRQVGLPQATINRLLLGSTADPRANTLKPIANFFNVTIEQLLGDEPLTGRIQGSYNPTENSWISVPILTWKDVKDWEHKKNTLTPNNHSKWITIDNTKISKNSFALPSLASMEPRFHTGSTLIIDPEHSYQDGSYIVVSIHEKTFLRKLVMDGSQPYLSTLHSAIPEILLDSSFHVHGVLVESRLSF